MITGELRSQVDKIWEAFWTGGISNPLTVIEQFTFLLFLRRLDEQQLLAEKKPIPSAARCKTPSTQKLTRNFAGIPLKISTLNLYSHCLPSRK